MSHRIQRNTQFLIPIKRFFSVFSHKMSLNSCPNRGCRKTFKYRMERTRHLDCEKCEGVPPDPSVVAEKKVKNDNDMCICKKCNTEVTHINNISRHLKVCKVKKVQKQKYSCDICQKIFLFKSKLERHIATHSRPSFECQYCSKIFNTEDHHISLQTHIELYMPTIPTIPTMVDMLQYDRSEVRVDGSTDPRVSDLDIQIETEKIQIFNGAF